MVKCSREGEIMDYVVTCAFGIEAVLKREMQALGLNITRSTNGRIYFQGDQKALFKANLHLRTADRVFILLGQSKVMSYDALFDFIKGLPLSETLSSKGKYHINAKAVKSTLYSPRDIQSITKKALIENLKVAYKKTEFKEEGEYYRLSIELLNDTVEVLLDTSGESLHKRGYRLKQGIAPLKETLASALVQLSFYNEGRVLYDPFCGSGTILIEAAMIAKNIAPGLSRDFAFLAFPWVDKQAFQTLKKEAYKAINHSPKGRILGSDNDMMALEMAKTNAIEAGVEDIIDFEFIDFEDHPFTEEYGIIITNPPYGERLETIEDAEILYRKMGAQFKRLKTYSIYLITSYPGVEGLLHKKADRTRVLFNGNIKTRYYQYYGPKPL